MIQILSVKDETQKKELCKKAGIAFSDELHINASFTEDGNIEYGAIFRFQGENGEILWMDAESKDMDLICGIGKAILSIMELRGVKEVTLPLSYAELAKLLHFEKASDVFKVNLEGYFCCGCQHK